MQFTHALPLTVLPLLFLFGCNDSGKPVSMTPRSPYTASVKNITAYIPEQCYAVTADEYNLSRNPCFTCHTGSEAPNYIDDASLQSVYPAAQMALTNPWENLFKDRSDAVAALNDDAMKAYIAQDNYRTVEGKVLLREKLLNALPPEWDANANGKWDGYLPDCNFRFDEEGFDRDGAGGYSGWRALAYAPFPGAFWPTNGSAGDVMVRLSDPFRNAIDGTFDPQTYRLNLAIVEALITRSDVPIETTDERRFGIDLDKDGSLAEATQITYRWEPLKGENMSYVGEAATALVNEEVHLAAGLFPEGTEFLHSVRYLQERNGTVGMAPRIKELRYGVKRSWYSYSTLKQLAQREQADKAAEPGKYRRFSGNFESGLFNGQGWRFQGFIEDRNGDLRPQTHEESLYCMGCHGGVGATTDSIFSFARKPSGGGWFHWSQKEFETIAEPRMADGRFAYTAYLQVNRAADPFGENGEAAARFFAPDGALKSEAIDALHGDIGTLLLPSPERAMLLNKAYKVIVDEQSFASGRMAHVKPVTNIRKTVKPFEPTGVKVVY